MSIVSRLEAFFEGTVVEVSAYECPQCGERLAPGETRCPDCEEEAEEVTDYVPVDADPY